jgi:type I restriction enzyme M protein
VDCYAPGQPRTARAETERFQSFSYEEIIARDKTNLDITWLRNDSLDDLDNLPEPAVIIAREIVMDLTAALAEFETALEDPADGVGSPGVVMAKRWLHRGAMPALW